MLVRGYSPPKSPSNALVLHLPLYPYRRNTKARRRTFESAPQGMLTRQALLGHTVHIIVDCCRPCLAQPARDEGAVMLPRLFPLARSLLQEVVKPWLPVEKP